MKQPIQLVALLLLASVNCLAEDLTLPVDVIMRSDRSLTSLKAGTVVEVVSRDDSTITIRYNGQTGSIKTSSLAAAAPTAAKAEGPAQKPPAAAQSPRSVTMGTIRFYRAYAPAESPVKLREYVPAGETIEHWNRLVSVRVIKDLNYPGIYLQKVAKSNPAARSRLLQNNETKDLVRDFMTFAPTSSPHPFAE